MIITPVRGVCYESLIMLYLTLGYWISYYLVMELETKLYCSIVLLMAIPFGLGLYSEIKQKHKLAALYIKLVAIIWATIVVLGFSSVITVSLIKFLQRIF